MANVFNTVDNVDLATALGGVPAAGSDVYINKYATQFSTGMDLSANDLNSFRITEGFTGLFAADAVLLVNNGGAGKIINEGASKEVRIKAASGAGVLYYVENNPKSGGSLFIGQGTVTIAITKAGYASYSDVAIVTNAYTTGGSTTFEYCSTALTGLYIRGGSVLLKRDVGVLSVLNGSCTINDSRVSPTTVNLESGGTLNLAECGDIGTLNASGGVLDFTKLTRPITIGTTNIEPNVKFIKNVSTDSLVTFTTVNRPRGRETIEQR